MPANSLELLSKSSTRGTIGEVLPKTLGDLDKAKQADLGAVEEILTADVLFESVNDKLAALDEPEPNISAQRFGELLTDFVTLGIPVYEGIPGFRSLWREAERYVGNRVSYHYKIDPTQIRADLPYRIVSQLKTKTVEQIVYILGSRFGHKGWETRTQFLNSVIYNTARSEMRRSRMWVPMEMLDRDARDKSTTEEQNARVWGSTGPGKRFSPKPWIAHQPIGKQSITPRDLVDGSNGQVDPIVQGLAQFWIRAAYSAAAPEFRAKTIKQNLELASVHYRNELNMLAAADSVIYPSGGPTKIPASISDGNEAEFDIRWILQTRAKYANRTMIPYLGTQGYTKKLTKNDEAVMGRLRGEIMQVLARAYAGRLNVNGMHSLPDQISGPWSEFNRGVMKQSEGTVKDSQVPKALRDTMIKEMSKVIHEPVKLLKNAPVAKVQRPRTPAEMKELDDMGISTMSSIEKLATIQALAANMDLPPEKAKAILDLALKYNS